ncbi:endoglucanase II [Gaeumannomyces tritici R3-111a-1]|uniref:lytic cellulose monooxygenase (C4-dehydrogenating) n=1 Tax=Gaeumannomyces tritici (strain R3-111a-1) TaxID=644352 RepID=J3P870_GAET3|nr:endoglucanase II [Gaeumannomyces tritici R3-111a-1]EJT72853.1 endoglucanase II [Gaeumannomyces tritici R3-111a-1]
MKGFFSLAAVLSLAVGDVSAHYIFQQFTAGGTKFPTYQHIRKNTNYNSPVTSLSSPDLRCNEGGLNGGSTSIVDIKAGDSFTFSLDTPVYHQGPISVYMSKAPGSVSSYQGDGDWFKTQDWGPTFNGGQSSWPMTGSYTSTIPRCIPNGEYLLRIQSLAIHNPGGVPQFYISCAQIRVSGGGSKAATNTVKIPGFIKGNEPGYTANIYNNFKSYTIPGPSVFTC